MQVSVTITGELSSIIAALMAVQNIGGTVTTHPQALTLPGAPVPAPIASDDDEGPVNPGAPATDIRGLPWDERIHAKSRALTQEGNWRRRKGVDDGIFNAIENDLRSRAAPPMPQPQPMPQPAPQPMPQPVPQPYAQPQPMPQPAPQPMPQPVPQPVPQPQQAPVAAPVVMAQPAAVAAPVTAPAAGGLDFTAFMQHIGTKTQQPGPDGQPMVNADYLASLVGRVAHGYQTQLNGIQDIQGRPELIAYAVQLMQHDGRW